jgi:acetolactate synthase regulatory subunit
MQTIYARLEKGMDSFIRVTSTLRRREFEISGMNLQAVTSGTGSHEMHIQLEGSNPDTATRAMQQLEKLVDVTFIELLKEEV